MESRALEETNLLNRTLHLRSYVCYVNALSELNFQINRLYSSGVIDPSVVKCYTQALQLALAVHQVEFDKFFHHLLWN